MKTKAFALGLGWVVAVQLILVFFVSQFAPRIGDHLGFILTSSGALALFCIMVYAFARIILSGSKPGMFIQLIMVTVFLKMLICLALIIGYKTVFHPSENSFVWAFLIIYVTSTMYEVYFLEKTGRAVKKTIEP